MITFFVILVFLGLIIFSAGRAKRNYALNLAGYVFWGANVYYLVLFCLVMIIDVYVDYAGYEALVSLSDDSALILALIVALSIFSFAIGELVTQRFFLKRYERKNGNKNVSAARLIGWFCTLTAIPAILSGAGSSYDDFVSGRSIGWGVTFLYIASSGYLVVANTSRSWREVLAAASLPLFAGLYMSTSTGVRSLIALPLLSILVSVFDRLRCLKSKSSASSIVFLLVAVTGGLYAYVSFERNGEVVLPELFTASIFFSVFEDEIAKGLNGVGDSAIMRLVCGVLYFPASKLGVPFPMLEDSAVDVGSRIMGAWAPDWAHFPGTWFLDLILTAGYHFWFDSFVLGCVITLCSILIRELRVWGWFFLPLFSWFLILVVRGAFYTGATSVSSAITMIAVTVFVLRLMISLSREVR